MFFFLIVLFLNCDFQQKLHTIIKIDFYHKIRSKFSGRIVFSLTESHSLRGSRERPLLCLQLSPGTNQKIPSSITSYLPPGLLSRWAHLITYSTSPTYGPLPGQKKPAFSWKKFQSVLNTYTVYTGSWPTCDRPGDRRSFCSRLVELTWHEWGNNVHSRSENSASSASSTLI